MRVAILIVTLATLVNARVFEKCTLAKELEELYSVNRNDAKQWVCVAEFESGFNSSMVALNEGVQTYGIFQLKSGTCGDASSVPIAQTTCNIPCSDFLNPNLADDIACAKEIANVNGFSYWDSYGANCQDRDLDTYIQECYDPPERSVDSTGSGRVFEKCDLATELETTFQLPRDDIKKYVCIAEFSSSFNTSEVSESSIPNAANYGLFKINSKFWCGNNPEIESDQNQCNTSCENFINSDITDDIKCAREIVRKTSASSEGTVDGFEAWTQFQQYCTGRDLDLYMNDCWNTQVSSSGVSSNTKSASSGGSNNSGRVYTKCELAKELETKFHLQRDDIMKYVCVAEFSSNFNTSAVSNSSITNAANYGLFKINSKFWCGNDADITQDQNKCQTSCSSFLDSDITDDLSCAEEIVRQTRISSDNTKDGFEAWAQFQQNCAQRDLGLYMNDCWSPQAASEVSSSSVTKAASTDVSSGPGQIYEKCVLAEELETKFKLPRDDIKKYICIAEFSSNFNTSAVSDSSIPNAVNYGLFKINSKFWCGNNPDVEGDQNGCKTPCSNFIDSDITDDLNCAKEIVKQHSDGIADGFQAWSQFQQYCSGKDLDLYMNDCWNTQVTFPGVSSNTKSASAGGSSNTGRVYKKCELAKELETKFHLQRDDIMKYVCVAEFSSNFNTSAVSDSSITNAANYGLFKINSKFWCGNDADITQDQNKCQTSCSNFLDSDITDDLSCAEEIVRQTRVSSDNAKDGFEAWTQYQQHCAQRDLGLYMNDCWNPQAASEISSSLVTKAASPDASSEKCVLAEELETKFKLPRNDIKKYICIAEFSSNFNTSAVSDSSIPNATNYGLFKINSRFWCGNNPDIEGDQNSCDTSCENFLDSDITDDLECAQKIVTQTHAASNNSVDGFEAWAQFQEYCKEKDLDAYMTDCWNPQSSS